MFYTKNFRSYVLLANIVILFEATIVLTNFRLDDIRINKYHFASSKIHNIGKYMKIDKRHTKPNQIIFALKLEERVPPWTVIIRRRKCDVIFDSTQYLVLNEERQNATKFEENLYEGYLLERPNNSSVNGYIKSNCFYGHILVNNTFYYVDEQQSIFLNNSEEAQKLNAVVYRKDEVIITAPGDESSKRVIPRYSPKEYLRMFRSWKKNGKLCKLIVVIDYSFLNLLHKGDKDTAVSHVLLSLEEANAVFRSTDFDGDGYPDNIGFYVKRIVVQASPEPFYYINPYTKKFIDVNIFIQKFRGFSDLKDYCLGIIVTAQKFEMKTLGASFSADNKDFLFYGGVCDSRIPHRGSFNALVVTGASHNHDPVPQILFEVTIAHEIGHSFGSSHDSQSFNCVDYIMAARTHKDYEGTRMRFSPCSKEQIIRTLVMKGKCFEPANTSFCGNGIIEDDEQCDCGLTRDCLAKDPCCTPRRSRDYPCRVNKKLGYQCHPSQGECCTDKCTYSTHLNKYVSCKGFEQICPCSEANQSCSCGINGNCIDGDCHSMECIRLNLRECKCSQEKTEQYCPVCCEFENQCISALDATHKIVNEGKDVKAMAEMFSSNSKYTRQHGRSWKAKKFCFESKCVTYDFFQGKNDEFCLFKGKLGKCHRNSFKCEIYQRNTHPKLKSDGTVTLQSVQIYLTTFLSILIYEINVFS